MGVESTSVVLSIALLYIDTSKPQTWESLYGNTIFVKLQAKEQVENYKRTIDKETLKWWDKKPDLVKQFSFIPKKTDLTAKEAIEVLRKYVAEQTDKPENTIVWTRGSLDQMALDSLFVAVGEEKLFPYHIYRDVRTYVNICATKSTRGYCDISGEYPGVWDRNVVMKHVPIDDICLDALMLLYPA